MQLPPFLGIEVKSCGVDVEGRTTVTGDDEDACVAGGTDRDADVDEGDDMDECVARGIEEDVDVDYCVTWGVDEVAGVDDGVPGGANEDVDEVVPVEVAAT